jgi:hypothetical protein
MPELILLIAAVLIGRFDVRPARHQQTPALFSGNWGGPRVRLDQPELPPQENHDYRCNHGNVLAGAADFGQISGVGKRIRNWTMSCPARDAGQGAGHTASAAPGDPRLLCNLNPLQS